MVLRYTRFPDLSSPFSVPARDFPIKTTSDTLRGLLLCQTKILLAGVLTPPPKDARTPALLFSQETFNVNFWISFSVDTFSIKAPSADSFFSNSS